MPSTFQLADAHEKDGECVNTLLAPQPQPANPLSARVLSSAARPTQPLEPILFPKLRIHYADFP